MGQLGEYIQKSVLRSCYELFAFLEADILREQKFMNLGLVIDEQVALRAEDEKEHLQRQLYYYVTKRVDLKDKTVLEVGCGRGGGSHFISEYKNPRSVTGIDITKGNIRLCQRLHSSPGLSFQQGDAEKISFPERSFDVVLNVESSHHYPNMGKFVMGVHRVLKDEGFFIFCDLGRRARFDEVERLFSTTGFSMFHQEDITQNILRAIEVDDDRKLSFINKWPRLANNKIIRRFVDNFAVMKDSDVYKDLKDGKWAYKHYILRKASGG